MEIGNNKTTQKNFINNLLKRAVEKPVKQTIYIDVPKEKYNSRLTQSSTDEKFEYKQRRAFLNSY